MATQGPDPITQEDALMDAALSIADPRRLGIVEPEGFAQVFLGSNLPPETLGGIWETADNGKHGHLTRSSFRVALRLVGYAQHGHSIHKDLAKEPGPLAVIGGLPVLISAGSTSLLPTDTIDIHPLAPEDRKRFLHVFARLPQSHGRLSVEDANNVFNRSRLPPGTLRQIWELVDPWSTKSLDSTGFVLAMYLIQRCMSYPGSSLPKKLPPVLLGQASGVTEAETLSSNASGSNHGARPLPVPRPVTRQSNPSPTEQPSQESGAEESVLAHHTGDSDDLNDLDRPATSSGDISSQEKADADALFDRLDKRQLGYLEGDDVRDFFLLSKLSKAVLARIWELVDTKKDGRLTREAFAVTLRLIKDKLLGKEVPSVLPPSLLPSLHRSNSQVKPHSTNNASLSTGVVPGSASEAGALWERLNSYANVLESAKSEVQSQQTKIDASNSTLASLKSQIASTKSALEAETKLLSDISDASAQLSSQIAEAQEELTRSESELNDRRQQRSTAEAAMLHDRAKLQHLQGKIKQNVDAVELLTRDIRATKREHQRQKDLLAAGKEQLAAVEGDRRRVEMESESAKGALTEVDIEAARTKASLREIDTLLGTGPVRMPATLAPNIYPTPTGSKNPFISSTSFPPVAFPEAALPPTSLPASGPVDFEVAFARPPVPSAPAAPFDDPFGWEDAFTGPEPLIPSPPVTQPRRVNTEPSFTMEVEVTNNDPSEDGSSHYRDPWVPETIPPYTSEDVFGKNGGAIQPEPVHQKQFATFDDAFTPHGKRKATGGEFSKPLPIVPPVEEPSTQPRPSGPSQEKSNRLSKFRLLRFGKSKKAANGKSPASLAGANDAEDVKEICEMGFTREQAVLALEKCNYDLLSALDYLAETT